MGGTAVIYVRICNKIVGSPFNNLALFEDPSSSLTHEWCAKTDGCQYFLPLDLEDFLPNDYHAEPLIEREPPSIEEIRALLERDDDTNSKRENKKATRNPTSKSDDWNRRLNRLRNMITNQVKYKYLPTPLLLVQARRNISLGRTNHTTSSSQKYLEPGTHFALLSRRGLGDSHRTNQDRSVLIDPYPVPVSNWQDKTQEKLSIDSNFFQGVFDGHSGHDMAQFVSTTLPTILLEHLSNLKAKPNNKFSEDQIRQAFKLSFTETHRRGRSLVYGNSGCTATVIVRLRQHLVFANAGDSSSFLLQIGTTSSGKVTFEHTTRPHKPNDPVERRRILGAGCIVVDPDPLNDPTARVTESGVDGAQALAMSRSIGDYDLEHCGVTANPTVTIVDLNAYKQRKTVLLAVSVSDGMSDYVSLDEIAHGLSSVFSKTDSNFVGEAELAIEDLIRTASDRWLTSNAPELYRDDISLVVRRVK